MLCRRISNNVIFCSFVASTSNRDELLWKTFLLCTCWTRYVSKPVVSVIYKYFLIFNTGIRIVFVRMYFLRSIEVLAKIHTTFRRVEPCNCSSTNPQKTHAYQAEVLPHHENAYFLFSVRTYIRLPSWLFFSSSLYDFSNNCRCNCLTRCSIKYGITAKISVKCSHNHGPPGRNRYSHNKES